MGIDQKLTELPSIQRRFLLYSIAVTLVFLLLAARLWYLQVISYDDLLERSVRNRTRVLILNAPRGPVFDRNEVLLVENRPSFEISVMRQDVEDRDLLLERLSTLLGSEIEELEKRWQKGRHFPIYQPVTLATDVSWDVMERVQEHSIDLPGVLTEVQPVRDYLDHGSAAHLIGYLGEITEEELAAESDYSYRGGDLVGKTALEKSYEPYLRGTKGRRLVEVDVKGKLLRQLQVEPSKPGNKVYLTIDQQLQEAADEVFGDQAGAAVAIDTHNGEILAMVSRPTFNPGMFARGIAGEEWKTLASDSRHPLQNKVIGGLYPPGSTFKMIVALAALREGIVGTHRSVNCKGDFMIGGARFRCWKKSGHGPTDLNKALRESCDVWFYQVGLELGIDKLSQAAREFGLGSPVGYPLPGERAGVIPSQEWKREHFNKPWYAGETVIASIGQGFVTSTPLQLAVMTAAIANEGKVFAPQVIRKVEDWEGNVLFESSPQVVRQLNYPKSAWDAVKKGMMNVVNDPRGTGKAAYLEDVMVAGKTGTSQVVRRKSDEEEEEEINEAIPYKFRPHALFVAFAPAANPDIAVAVVIEHGQSGGRAAGPVARGIIDRYMQLKAESKKP